LPAAGGVSRRRCRALFSGLLLVSLLGRKHERLLAGVADHEVLWTVLNETTFGSVWMARMLLIVIILGVTTVRPAIVGRDLVTACLVAVLLASLAGTGHAQIEEGWMSLVHVGSDAAHLLAAGAWLGGLVPRFNPPRLFEGAGRADRQRGSNFAAVLKHGLRRGSHARRIGAHQ